MEQLDPFPNQSPHMTLLASRNLKVYHRNPEAMLLKVVIIKVGLVEQFGWIS
jgi:hypothetical protein